MNSWLKLLVAVFVFASFLTQTVKAEAEKPAAAAPEVKAPEASKVEEKKAEPVSEVVALPEPEAQPVLEKPAAAAPEVKAPEASKPLDASTVLVKIKNKTITEGDVRAKIAEIHKMLEQRGIPPDRLQSMSDMLRPQVIEELVALNLIDQAAEAKGITVKDEDVNSAVEQMRLSLPPGMSFDDVIEESGMSKAEFEATLKKQIVPQIKIEKLLNVENPTEKEMQDFYDTNKRMFESPERVRARHILIAVDEDDTADIKADKKKKAQDVRRQLVEEKADFAKLAKANSACPSKEKGGDLGFFGKGQMVPEFEKAAFTLKKDEISDIVETPFGFHLIQTTDKQEAKKSSFEDAKFSIATMLRRKQISDKVEDFMQNLHEEAKIEYFHDAAPKRMDDDLPIIMAPSDAGR